jgi:CheY-like chemotaxis protein
LLVEDHLDTAKTRERLLAGLGHTVTLTHTLAAALEAVAAGNFDLVLSDLGLPDGTGYDLMDFIRREKPVPGIALSGYAMDEDVRRSTAAGFAAHITNPVNFDGLLAVIDEVTAGRNAGAGGGGNTIGARRQ